MSRSPDARLRWFANAGGHKAAQGIARVALVHCAACVAEQGHWMLPTGVGKNILPSLLHLQDTVLAKQEQPCELVSQWLSPHKGPWHPEHSQILPMKVAAHVLPLLCVHTEGILRWSINYRVPSVIDALGLLSHKITRTAHSLRRGAALLSQGAFRACCSSWRGQGQRACLDTDIQGALKHPWVDCSPAPLDTLPCR